MNTRSRVDGARESDACGRIARSDQRLVDVGHAAVQGAQGGGKRDHQSSAVDHLEEGCGGDDGRQTCALRDGQALEPATHQGSGDGLRYGVLIERLTEDPSVPVGVPSAEVLPVEWRPACRRPTSMRSGKPGKRGR